MVKDICKSPAMMLLLLGVASCVDEYNVLPEGVDDQMLVVEGNIVSNNVSRFSLYHTISLNSMQSSALQGVTGADVTVKGSNGDCYIGYATDNGEYEVPTGHLNPDAEYWVELNVPAYGEFRSDAMKPLDAPEIKELSYSQPHSDMNVQILVTTEEMNGLHHLLWHFEECYEVHAPIYASWTYNPENDKIVPLTPSTWQGWREYVPKFSIFTSNEDYNLGPIVKYCLYTKLQNDYRFMVRYRTKVFQEAISTQEYEYRKVMQTQSSEMGGLFTPMPTELPSNVRGTKGEKAIGYVGVRGYVASKVMYINREDVGYNYYVKYDLYDTEDSKSNMYEKGYRVAEYDEYAGDGSLQWADRYVVDVTAPYWNANLVKPDYWEDAK